MGLIEAIGSLFGGGGGGSSVTYGVTSTVQGGERPVGLVSTIQGGDRAVGVDVGLDDVNVDVGGTGTPLHSIGELRTPDQLRTATDLGIDFTRPIVSEIDSKLDSRLDLEPVQVDLCVNVGLTTLPRACIQQPYSSRFGVTVLGTEVVGFTLAGRSEVLMDQLDDRPHVELGRVAGMPTDPHRDDRAIGTDGGNGLHVRLG